MNRRTTVIDADNLILGRMAAVVAKRLLNGEEVTILNSEKAVISGKKHSKVEEAMQRLDIGHPRKGPYFPRRPDRFVKRTIRGMLPRKKPKGKDAYRRLRVFIGMPKEFEESERETIPEARAEKLKSPYVKVSQLVAEIGWTPVTE